MINGNLDQEKLFNRTIINKLDVKKYNEEIGLFPFINIDVFNHKNKSHDLDFDVFIISTRKNYSK